MLAAVPVDMPQSLGDYLIHQLHGLVQANLSILDPGDGQQVFHQVDEPLGIVINIRKGPHPVRLVHLLVVGQQIAGAAGDGGQGSAQVVGDSSEQVGPELLASGQGGGLLFLPDVILQAGGQGTGQQGHHEHNRHGHQVVGVAEPEGEPGNGKEEVEYQHTDHTGQQSAHWACGDYRADQDGKQIDGDNVGLREPKRVEEKADQGGRQQHQGASSYIPAPDSAP